MYISGSSRGAGPSYNRSQQSRASRDRRIADLLRYALCLSGGTGAFVMSPADRTKALHPTGVSQDAASSAAREIAGLAGMQGDKLVNGTLLMPKEIGSASSLGECVLVCGVLCIINADKDRAGRIACEMAIVALARLVRREMEAGLVILPGVAAAGLLRVRGASARSRVVSS